MLYTFTFSHNGKEYQAEGFNVVGTQLFSVKIHDEELGNIFNNRLMVTKSIETEGGYGQAQSNDLDFPKEYCQTIASITFALLAEMCSHRILHPIQRRSA